MDRGEFHDQGLGYVKVAEQQSPIVFRMNNDEGSTFPSTISETTDEKTENKPVRNSSEIKEKKRVLYSDPEFIEGRLLYEHEELTKFESRILFRNLMGQNNDNSQEPNKVDVKNMKLQISEQWSDLPIETKKFYQERAIRIFGVEYQIYMKDHLSYWDEIYPKLNPSQIKISEAMAWFMIKKGQKFEFDEVKPDAFQLAQKNDEAVDTISFLIPRGYVTCDPLSIEKEFGSPHSFKDGFSWVFLDNRKSVNKNDEVGKKFCLYRRRVDIMGDPYEMTFEIIKTSRSVTEEEIEYFWRWLGTKITVLSRYAKICDNKEFVVQNHSKPDDDSKLDAHIEGEFDKCIKEVVEERKQKSYKNWANEECEKWLETKEQEKQTEDRTDWTSEDYRKSEEEYKHEFEKKRHLNWTQEQYEKWFEKKMGMSYRTYCLSIMPNCVIDKARNKIRSEYQLRKCSIVSDVEKNEKKSEEKKEEKEKSEDKNLNEMLSKPKTTAIINSIFLTTLMDHLKTHPKHLSLFKNRGKSLMGKKKLLEIIDAQKKESSNDKSVETEEQSEGPETVDKVFALIYEKCLAEVMSSDDDAYDVDDGNAEDGEDEECYETSE